MRKLGLPFEQFIDGKWIYVEDSTKLKKGYIIRIPESYQQVIHS